MPRSSEISTIFGRDSVRSAFKIWHESKALGEHPLARTQLTEQRRYQARQSWSDTPAGRGIALRQILHEALELIRPDDPTPDFSNPQWRYYLILHQQFVREQRASQIQDMLGISESGYFKDQRHALERLGAILREREEALRESGRAEEGQGADQEAGHAHSVSAVLAPFFEVPLQPTPFIGRFRELARLHTLLTDPACRLLTIVGPGGMGKTRLAVEAARRMAGDFAHGVAWVPLAPLRNADMLAPTIASAIQLALGSSENVRHRLAQFLQQREMLLVLDNFEQLVNNAELLRFLLARCPGLKLLVTSRFSLDIQGEWILEIAGLDLPPTADDPDFEAYPAVALFATAMRRVQPGISIAPEDRGCVLELCHLLGGMPLGIELAASWLPMLSCHEIVAEIGRNADFLASTLRDLPARHRSLRGIFDHSWELLSDAERQALQRMAVFPGSFSREAAREIASADLTLLRALRNKSLIRVDTSGRYVVQELLRQYAEEKLRRDGDAWQETRQRHSDWFLHFLHERSAALRCGLHQLRTHRQLWAEQDDLRLAWEWAVRQKNLTPVVDLAIPFFLLYDLANRAREGLSAFSVTESPGLGMADRSALESRLLCRAVLARFHARAGHESSAEELVWWCLDRLQAEQAADTPIDPHLAALVVMVCLPSAALHARQEQADALYTQARHVFSQAGDQWCLAHLELNRAMQLRHLDQPGLRDAVQALFQRSLTLLEALPDLWGVSRALNYLGTLAWERGDYDSALSLGQRSLELYQELGDRLGTAYAFCTVGQVFSTRGHYALGQSYYRDGIAIYRELGNAQELAAGLDSMGYVTYLLGDLDQAEACYRESLALSRSLNDKSGTAWSLHNLGDIARVRLAYDEARRLYEESQALHFADNPQSWGRIAALGKLGRIELLLQNRGMAWEYHHQAWQLALQMGRPREALDALWALFRVVQDDRGSRSSGHDQALLTWLHLVCHHPGTAEDTRQEAEGVWETISADPDSDPAHPAESAHWLTLPMAEWATLPLLDRSHWFPPPAA